MKPWLIVLICLGTLVSCSTRNESGPTNPGHRIDIPIDSLKAQFRDPGMIYAPFVFWFWDEPLNPDKMAEMARVMGSQGFNPGYAHARHSMIDAPSLPDSQWLGREWFGSFRAALAEAEKSNQYLGYCDEYWWPSFQAKGRVLKDHPELRAESLQWETIDVDGNTEIQVPASFCVIAARLNTPVEKKQPKPQFGKWIWSPDGEETGHTCWFRHTFNLPEEKTIAQADLRITADNEFILYVNGERVAESTDWEKPVALDLAKTLLPGENLLALECRNVGGRYGLTAGIRVTFSDESTVEIGTDKNWITSLTGKNGWEKSVFNTGNWVPAQEIANPGDQPWSVISNIEPHKSAIIQSQTIQLIGSGDPFTWKVPSGGMWRVYVFNKYFHPGAADGQQCNSIDSRLGAAFIRVALEPYAKEFGDRMGRSIPGDFIDHEGDYGWQLAWSGSLDSSYLQRHGQDIRLILPLLLDTDIEGTFARSRWEWFDLVSDLYAGNFKQLRQWHEQRGMYTTAHVWEEGLQPQVNCVGDHMKILRALTMPGQDCLGLKALRVHDFKEPQSVSEFENVRFASEVLGASDFEPGMGLWGSFTPSLLKQSVNSFTTWGVSHVIPHGVFTNRQLKGNPWPPDWYSENPMFPWMHLWTGFVRRASLINSMGHTVPDVLLYNPMESAWIHANAPLLDVNGMWSFDESLPEGQRINEIDKIYSGAINDLTDARIEFLVGDRYYLDQMKVKKGELAVGSFAFSTIILPRVEILTLDVAKKILAFAKAGGRVFSLGELPSASVENGLNDPAMVRLMENLKKLPNYTACSDNLKSMLEKEAPGLQSQVQFLSGSFPMLQQHRRIDGIDFFWLVNNQEQGQSCEIRINGAKGAASIWDCETGEIRPVSSTGDQDGSTLHLSFKPLEAFWLVMDPRSPANQIPGESELQPLMKVDGPWKITYDPAIQPDMEFPFQPTAAFVQGVDKPLEDWKIWGLEPFSGLLDYSKTVMIELVEGRIFLDLGQVCHVAEVWMNGQSVGKRMWGPYVFDLTAAVKPGPNEIKVRIANLINNSYGDLKESGLMGPVRILSRN